MDTNEFLEALFGGLKGKFLYLWTLPGRSTYWFKSEDIESMATKALQLSANGDSIYFGLGAGDASKSAKDRLLANEVTVIPGIWVDLDIAGTGHAATNLPTNINEAMTILDCIPLIPSIVIHSGGGLHAYWLFQKPWELDTAEEKANAAALIKGIQLTLREKNPQFKIDATQSLSQVLRPPGTTNYKDKNNIKTVTVIAQSDTSRYTFDDLNVYAAEPTTEQYRKMVTKFKRRPTDRPAETIIKNCEWIKRCRDDANVLTYPEWMSMLTNIGRARDGEEVAHELSQAHGGYSVSETNKKLFQAIEMMGPTSCEYIRGVLGFNGCPSDGCGVKNPAGWALNRDKQGEFDIETEQTNFNRTDAGNAELLANRYKDKIRFCFDCGKWLIFDGKRWKIDTTNQIYQFAKKTMRAAYKASKGSEDAQKYYRASESKAKMVSAVFLAQTLLPIATEELDCNKWLLNAQNGVIDLRTGELLPHDPAYFMTKICKVDYVPDDTGTLWGETLSQIIPNKEVRDFIQRFAGYSLTGSTREEKFLILSGEGGTGKGTVTETLGDVLGDYADTLSTDVLLQSRNATSGNEPTPEIAKLPGVRLLLASETGQGRMLDEAKIKAMTGGDRITCRRLRCDPFTFQPDFKLWLSTNHVPRVRGTDDGVWRRIRLVPFDQQFKDGQNRDNTVKERLHDFENLKSVLVWAVQGCLDWQKQGLNEPNVVVKTTNDFRQECDLIEQFFADECEIKTKYEAPVKSFYRAFKSWCLENGHFPASSSTFSRMMEFKKYVKMKKSKGWFWTGIKLSNYDF